MPDKRIYDVDVNRKAVKKGASFAEFKTNNPHIFNHLSAEDEDAAYKELFAEQTAPVSKPVAAPAAEAAPAKANP